MRIQRTGGLEKSSFLWDLAGQAEDSSYDMSFYWDLWHISIKMEGITFKETLNSQKLKYQSKKCNVTYICGKNESSKVPKHSYNEDNPYLVIPEVRETI